jgi:hypothetical protein
MRTTPSSEIVRRIRHRIGRERRLRPQPHRIRQQAVHPLAQDDLADAPRVRRQAGRQFDYAAIEERVRHVHGPPRGGRVQALESDGHHGARSCRTDSRRSTSGSTRDGRLDVVPAGVRVVSGAQRRRQPAGGGVSGARSRRHADRSPRSGGER